MMRQSLTGATHYSDALLGLTPGNVSVVSYWCPYAQ